METLWFMLVAFMLTAYVILDGFDLGAGIIHSLVAKTDEEKQLVLRSIGPVWDGNEVWLLAAGGTLYFAFPPVYASSFSGFYLPLMMVLWLLMLRAIGIELRSHIDNPMWRSFFDFIFSVSSLLLAIFFGAAIGNVIRGVPLNEEGYFFEALWTDFRVSANPGILDWYTVLTGVVALVTLTTHGANYVATKTSGDVNLRAGRVASITGWILVLLTIVSLIATLSVRPQMLDNYKSHVWGAIFPVIVAGALAAMLYFRAKGRDLAAFLSSTAYITGMLAGAAFAFYPNLLVASTDPNYSMTIHNSAAGQYGLAIGLIWWFIGICLALGYFIYLYRSFRGKVVLESEGY
jgi:cytochrome d ubiquinol oxidase subunit II